MVKTGVSLEKQGVIRYCIPMAKERKNRKKNRPPKLLSDADFLEVFEGKTRGADPVGEKQDNESLSAPDSTQSHHTFEETEEEIDFTELLEASFRNKKPRKKNAPKEPMPIQKRLKRYPPVETTLDLHGFTAVGAQVKARSFISSCKQKGLFTVRIIVGKGLHSDMGPVLPDVVEDVAKEMKHQGIVLSFQWEKKKKTDSGALIIYLKQFDQYD